MPEVLLDSDDDPSKTCFSRDEGMIQAFLLKVLTCFMFYAPLDNIGVCGYDPPPDDVTFGEMTIRKNVRRT